MIHHSAICTWALRFPDGSYILDPVTKTVGYDVDAAFVWLDEDRAKAYAFGSSRVVRAKP